MDTTTPRPLERTALSSTPHTAMDRRQNRRVAVTLLGRFMRANKQEHTCKLVDLSVTGAAVVAPVEVEMGERIVAYFDHIGGLEGHVVRIFVGGFAIELQATAHKREKLTSQINQLANRSENGMAIEARRHERVAVSKKQATLKVDEGISIEVNVLDFSMSGASVATAARPPIGTEIMLGKMRGRVARHHHEGIGIEFLDIQNTEAIRCHFG